MAKFIFQAGVFFKRPLYPANTSTVVTVYDAETGSIAHVWNDRAGADPRANPGAIWQEGQIRLYLNAGRYNIVASNGSDSKTWNDVIIVDPDAGGGGGVSTAVTALSISSGNVEVDVSVGALFTLDMTENVTSWTYTNTPGAGNGGSIMILVTQGDPARTLAINEGSAWTEGSLTVLDTEPGTLHLLAMTSFDSWATVGATMGKLLGVEPPAPDLIYLELNNIDELDPETFLDLTGEPGVLELNL